MKEAGAYKIAMAADVINRGGAGSVSIGLFDEEEQGLNSIEFQQDVEQNFQQMTGHSVRPNTVENHVEQSVEIQLN